VFTINTDESFRTRSFITAALDLRLDLLRIASIPSTTVFRQ